jgi:hypothetical protein
MELLIMKKGICFRCLEPLPNQSALGYHASCAEEAHAEREKEMDEKYPFVVLSGTGEELNRFATETEAIGFLQEMQDSEISSRLNKR